MLAAAWRPRNRAQIVDSRTAAQKAGKTARLLAEAGNAFTEYINTIAPGTVPAGYSVPETMPDGEALLTEAAERGRRADVAWRKQVQKAGDGKDSLENLEHDTRSFFAHHKNLQRPSGGTAVSVGRPVVQHQIRGDQVDNPIAATAMMVAAGATAVKAILDRKRRNQRREPGA